MKITALIQSAALAALFTLPASAQALESFKCRVTEVYAFSDRVHVKCASGTSRDETYIEYFAVPTSNSPEAARFTMMATMALGGDLWVEYEFYTGPYTFGCSTHNCRRALRFGLR